MTGQAALRKTTVPAALRMAGPAGWLGFAHHEARLAWRDGVSMLQGGRRGRGWWAALAVVCFTLALHAIAYALLEPSVDVLRHPDRVFIVALSGSAFLTWTLLLSQALETVTRFFYARADLDLILSSPAPARQIFAIRLGAIAVTTVAMAVLLVGPVINVMAVLGGARFLLAYGVLVAMGSLAAAVAIGATALLFRIVGPRRTRFVAQVIAAIVGAGFVVGVQAAAITSYGSLSRLMMFQSPAWIAAAPGPASALWWPAAAAMGDGAALCRILAIALGLFAVAMAATVPSFAQTAQTVASLPPRAAAPRSRAAAFRSRSRSQVLRRKEWILLRRDPWLVSQSLMQMLYLLPPALLLWHNFETDAESLAVLAPVVVMAAGQLAGGLAWLAISGEDAPDLVASAPITGAAVLRAKIEAVLIAVAIPVLPIAAAMAVLSPVAATATVIGAALAAIGASLIQVIFKTQARRTMFRRRQTASRLATFAEALVSIAIAAAAGLAAARSGFALVPLAFAASILLIARAIMRRPA